ncbi:MULTISPECIES: FHA domain-containing protein [Fischerella]|nr:FHA domain-containing protein [Fischerella muscicola]MBD2430266.1 FHA domain-containing protein [Fischerella sp. FACHB-380]
MITLILLHPLQPIPAQSWTFADDEPAILIGRAADNHVVLYSAVVSRRHLELRRVDNGWEVVNLGANGTYVDGEAIVRVPVTDGVILRLARSGPQIQIRLGIPTTTPVTKSQRCLSTLINTERETEIGEQADQEIESLPRKR